MNANCGMHFSSEMMGNTGQEHSSTVPASEMFRWRGPCTLATASSSLITNEQLAQLFPSHCTL